MAHNRHGRKTVVFAFYAVGLLSLTAWSQEINHTGSRKSRRLEQSAVHVLTTKHTIHSGSFASQSTTSSSSNGAIANFLLGGAQKAGTTALANYFCHRRDFCGPKARPGVSYTGKEAHFFDEDEMMAKKLSHYESLFDHCSKNTTRVYMDATPKYMLYPENVRKIYEEHGTADTVKIMFTLREPVSRDLSWYNHLLRENNKARPPEWAKEATDPNNSGKVLNFANYTELRILPSMREEHPSNRGLYAHWLRKWFKLFNRSQIFVASYDDFRRNETDFLTRVHAFLELPDRNPNGHAPKSNDKHAMNVDPIPCSVQEHLANEFEALNQELYDLLEANPGPPMEKRPFTRFQFKCKET